MIGKLSAKQAYGLELPYTSEFPSLVSYNRFFELMRIVMPKGYYTISICRGFEKRQASPSLMPYLSSFATLTESQLCLKKRPVEYLTN